MMSKRILKVLLFFLIIFITLYSYSTKAKAVEYVKGSNWCPQPEDESLASICGTVKSANIDGMIHGSFKNASPAYMTKLPIGGVTVSIYENVQGVPTGQPFGNLENKLVECVTSEIGGKYYCPVRRINPGNMVYVIFSCNGRVADIKIVPSSRNIVGLNSDVDCSNVELEYKSLPTTLTYADRDSFLGCASEVGKPNESITNEDKEIVYHSTQIGEEDGDIRFTPNKKGLLGLELFYTHPGAYWSKDCVVKYNNGSAGDEFGVPFGLSSDEKQGLLNHEFSPGITQPYGSPYEKCNYNPDPDSDADVMDPWDLSTTPYRYDIPEKDVLSTYRVWETRESVQRVLQDPRAYQQFNHLMFGDCLNNAYLRQYGEQEIDTPISCNELKNCTAIGDPLRNIHTTHSFGSRLANPITWVMIALGAAERDSSDVVCRDTEGDYGEKGADIIVAEVPPDLMTVSCKPGSPGCQYKVDFALPPQFFLIAEGVKKAMTSEAVDSYGPQAARDKQFDGFETAATNPHLSGHYVNYECSGVGKNNCGMTSLRISSSDEIYDGTTTGGSKGAMTDRFRGPVDVISNTYADDGDTIIYDAGGDIRGLCTISSVEDLLVIGSADEIAGEVEVNNFFTGDEVSHRSDLVAGTATYATPEAKERDSNLAKGETLDAYARDAFDSLQRFTSGGGTLTLKTLEDALKIFVVLRATIKGREEGTVKSFGHRVDEKEWNEGTPATVNTKYCISEDDFIGEDASTSKFPPYKRNVNNGYPGSAPEGCYPWEDVLEKQYCNVYPGPDNSPEGKLRTCKVKCKLVSKKRTCLNSQCETIYDSSGVAIGVSCTCLEEKVTKEIRSCNNDKAKVEQCLTAQKDTTHINPVNPPNLEGPGFEDTFSAEVTQCDLFKAGPMTDAGDIGGEDGFTHGARVVQQPFGLEKHYEVDSISASGNDTLNRWVNPVDSAKYTKFQKVAFNDLATTNEARENSISGNVHRTTAGAITKGEGFGGTSRLTDLVSNPLTNLGLAEEFPICDEASNSPHCWECNPLTVSESEWCKGVPPPGEVDLKSFEVGACTPKISGSCPLVAEVVGSLAEKIIGAAGEHAGGVPGSVILAAIVGEVDWLAKYDKVKDPETGKIKYVDVDENMKWDNLSIASYSSPWYARIPKCNDMMPDAQGPFGLLDSTFEGSVVGNEYAPFDDIGFHPDRLNSLGSIYTTYGSGDSAYRKPIVSKCNFIDAAYAAAPTLKSPAYDCSTDDLSRFEDEIRAELAGYRGMDVSNTTLDHLVDIALNCQ